MSTKTPIQNLMVSEQLRLTAKMLASSAGDPAIRKSAMRWERQLRRVIVLQAFFSWRPLLKLRQLRQEREDLSNWRSDSLEPIG
jgi:hypothetical protein